jgi:hypothetical protein
MEENKLHLKNDSLQQYAVTGKEFLHSIVMGDESWFHHFDPETKRQSTTLPKKNMLKIIPSASMTMGTVLWSSFCDTGKASMPIISFSHSRSYTVHCMTDVQGEKKDHPATQQCTAPHSWSVHGQNSEQRAGMSPSSTPMAQTLDYHLFGIVKDQMQGQHYVTNEAVQTPSVVYELLKRSSIIRGSSNL